MYYGIYFIFHHVNATKFTSLVPGNFNYSILKEALYFVKMVSPFLLIYSLYKTEFSKDKIIQIIKCLVLTISLVIIVSNLLGFSLGTYSNVTIKANFFDWFNPNSTNVYTDLASKGFFQYGNQTSAILLMFLPFMIYNVFKKFNFMNYFALICNVFALILLCTKVAVIGVAVAFIYTLFVFAFIHIIQKKKLNFKACIPILIVLIVYGVLLPKNPMFNRIDERSTTIAEFDKTKPSLPKNPGTEDKVSVDDMMQYIESTYVVKQVSKQFLFENYPYKYDPEFWYNFLQSDISLTTDYRYIELSMIKRVVEVNNSPMDKWFGITNTRLQNVFNIERDFVVQYYALGIIGIFLIFAPYFAFLAVFAYKTLKEKFINLTVANSLACITIVFLFGTSYMSGNLLNSLSFTIYFAICFYLIRG